MGDIRKIMTSNIEACTLLDNVYEVAVKMKEHDVGAIPVVDGETLVGIITDRDIVVRGVAEKKPGSSKVEEVMSGKLVTVSPETSADEAARLMAEHQIRRLPVVEGDNKLVGMVSLGDIALNPQSDSQAEVALSEISEHEHRHLQ
jgi:CBS domain-containing protein